VIEYVGSEGESVEGMWGDLEVVGLRVGEENKLGINVITLSFSLSHTHTNTHPHAHTHTYTHTYTHTHILHSYTHAKSA